MQNLSFLWYCRYSRQTKIHAKYKLYMVKSKYFKDHNCACYECDSMSSLSFPQISLKLYFCGCKYCNNQNPATPEGLGIYSFNKVKSFFRDLTFVKIYQNWTCYVCDIVCYVHDGVWNLLPEVKKNISFLSFWFSKSQTRNTHTK